MADCQFVNGWLFYRNRMYIPDHLELRLRLLHLAHSSPSRGHGGKSRTFEILSRHYFCHGLSQLLRRFVRKCEKCSRSKASNEKYNGLLHPLPVLMQAWKEVALDFVTGLPQVGEYNAICVVIDRLTKQRHYIPCADTIDARGTANLYCSQVYHLHGLPYFITSDRGSQFVNEFWSRLTQRLGVAFRLSTVYHSETDGQTENANKCMEQYLRSFVSYQQDDWPDWLPSAEFSANNHGSATTNVSPFFANYGFHPRMGIEPLPETSLQPISQRAMLQIEDADRFAEKMKQLHKFLREEITYAQALQEDYANKKRIPAPAYQVGARVFVDAQNLRSERPSRKLDLKSYGPYPIVKIISPYAYQLSLPPESNAHPVFHVNKLRLASNDPIPGQNPQPPPPLKVSDITDEWEYEVEEILDSRLFGRWKNLKYLVQFRGEATSWQPAKN